MVTRVNSLTNGISGQIFCDNYDIPNSVLFDQNTIVDLSRVGSNETKSLIMGITVLKLSEYRMAKNTQANSNLRHITVLEEAHNLLKKTSNESVGSNVIGKSVEMICNSIAEMRTYGEGFIIVDQSPTAVDISAIKNTNTKILMRLPEKNDSDAVGNAVGLNDEQKKELSRLETGVAVVMQNNWLEAVLCHIDAFSDSYTKKILPATYEELKILKSAVIQEFMEQYIVEKTMDIERMNTIIDSVDVSIYKKSELKYRMTDAIGRLRKNRCLNFFCETLFNLTEVNTLFDVIEPTIKEDITKQDKYSRESVRNWFLKLKKGLCEYVDLPERYIDTMIDYLLYIQEERIKTTDYYEIQRILEQDVR